MKVKSGRPWLGYYQPAATLGGSTTLSISALTRHPNPPFNTFPGYLRLNMDAAARACCAADRRVGTVLAQPLADQLIPSRARSACTCSWMARLGRCPLVRWRGGLRTSSFRPRLLKSCYDALVAVAAPPSRHPASRTSLHLRST